MRTQAKITFYQFVSGVNQGNQETGRVQDSPKMERFFSYLPQALKRNWEGEVEVLKFSLKR